MGMCVAEPQSLGGGCRMVPAAGENGVVTDLASLTLEVACRGDLVTVHVKVEDPDHPHVIASSQAFHLRRSGLDSWRLKNVFHQALGHAAVRLPKSCLLYTS